MDKRKKKRENKQKLKKNHETFKKMNDRKTDKTMYRLDMHMS